jgi:hypothetical protein
MDVTTRRGSASAEAAVVLDVDRAVDEVFAFLERPENLPGYSTLVVAARRTSAGPIALGSTAALTCRVLGRQFELRGRVAAYSPNHRLVLQTTWGPGSLEAEVTFEQLEPGTRVRAVVRGCPRGFFRLVEPVLLRLARRHLASAARTVKSILEAEGPTGQTLSSGGRTDGRAR